MTILNQNTDESKVLKRAFDNSIHVDNAENIYIYDTNGNKYLDSCSGAAVTSLGYSQSRIKDAICKQVNEVPYVHSGTFTTTATEELAQLLIKVSNDDFSKVVFSSSGSEAMEVAIKLAFQYWFELGENKRDTVITRRLSYHGGTLGTLGIGGQYERKEPFNGVIKHSKSISICHAYRYKNEHETLERYAKRAAAELEDTIIESGPDRVACFVAETVGGSTSGAVIAEKGYFKEIEKICNKYNVLFILDEVMCGMSRCGSHFAYQQEHVKPDIVSIAKGLASGYQAIASTLMSEKIASVLESSSAGFRHAGTYMGHATGCAAALATQKIIQSDQIHNNVNEMGQFLFDRLVKCLKGNPYVGDIRGRGLLLAIEFVLCKKLKTRIPNEIDLTTLIKNEGISSGIVLYPCRGSEKDNTSDHILIAPALIVNKDQINLIVEKICFVIDKVSNVLSIESSVKINDGKN